MAVFCAAADRHRLVAAGASVLTTVWSSRKDQTARRVAHLAAG
jgi:hypothetical protein